ncbi:DNA-directed DNA polymerase [Bacillus amyloliquefaciens]|nr:DNA-directed DNA polymerase [Bacillus amyloliquefaciens]
MEQLSVNRRQFQILLQQLNMTDDTFMTYFEDGEIDKLTIHKAEKACISNFALRLFCRIKYMIHS